MPLLRKGVTVVEHRKNVEAEGDGACRRIAGAVSNKVLGGSAEVVIQTGAIHGSVMFNGEATATAPTALRQLPPRLPEFVGRSEELSTVLGLLRPDTGSPSVAVTTVSGLAGVGKTALSIHAGHAAMEAGWFPGGVLFVDLHGYDENPTRASEAIDSLLRALGVPGPHIPPELDARAGLYRSQLAKSDGPVLVIADNASAAKQVLPLLPGEPRHRVLVTSRHRLRLSARLYELNILTAVAAVGLLDTAVRVADPSDSRIAADSRLAAQVASYCGRLPLALQIAAALLVGAPGKTLAELASELAKESDRLTHLDDGERAVRTAFNLSYRRLRPEQASLFRLLAINPGPDLSTEAAVVLAEEPMPQVQRTLDELLRAHMVERASTPSRWTMHDLLRDYAHGLAAQYPDDERRRRTDRR